MVKVPTKARSSIFEQLPIENVISEADSLKITGGTDHTLAEILATFNNTSQSVSGFGNTTPFSTEQYNYFVHLITQLNETSAGHALLNTLVDAGKPIYLNFDPVHYQGAEYSDDLTDAYNILSVGNLAVPGSTYDPTVTNEGTDFFVLAHELFHAYTDLVAFPNNGAAAQAYFSTNRSELDAELFATFATTQHDWEEGWNFANYYLPDVVETNEYTTQFVAGAIGNNTTYNQNINSTANALFKNAWDYMVDNCDFSLSHYNMLINTFNTGANYVGTTGLTANTINFVDPVISFFMTNFFSNDLDPYNPGQGGGSSGSSSGSGDNGSSYDLGASFWNWYNSYGQENNISITTDTSDWTQMISGATGIPIWVNKETGVVTYTDPGSGSSSGGNTNDTIYYGDMDGDGTISYSEYQSWNNFWDSFPPDFFGGNSWSLSS